MRRFVVDPTYFTRKCNLTKPYAYALREKASSTDLANFVFIFAAMFVFGSNSKLSEAEQEQAVLKLRESLSDGTQPVEEQLRQGGEAGLNDLDDITLRRWLRAENFDILKVLACPLINWVPGKSTATEQAPSLAGRVKTQVACYMAT